MYSWNLIWRDMGLRGRLAPLWLAATTLDKCCCETSEAPAEAGDDCGDESVDEKLDDDDELDGVELPEDLVLLVCAVVLIALKLVSSCSMLLIRPKIHTDSASGCWLAPA